METEGAVQAFAALGHASRLEAFRLLLQAGEDGVSAGEIARALDVPAPTLSFHLAHLSRAGLVTSRQEGRHVLYAVSVERFRDLLAFLLEDCCGGDSSRCLPGLEIPTCEGAKGERT
jgi:DNA-binding transcriptional ArsR family regulator